MAVHLLLPAAGTGRRFGAAKAKQYYPVLGKPLIEWTLTLWQTPVVNGERLLIVHPQDKDIDDIVPKFPEYRLIVGGQERMDSVLAGLKALNAADDDWVMVHDIARPCTQPGDIDALLERCLSSDTGGLLAARITDTVKRWRDGQVSTLDRSELWAAQTPQCFRYKPLLDALEDSQQQPGSITDEASAMERAGHPVQLVAGSGDNIKLTHPEDVIMIEAILRKKGLS